jgi:hypothetical protein
LAGGKEKKTGGFLRGNKESWEEKNEAAFYSGERNCSLLEEGNRLVLKA